jgi:Family of unknown function (DUF6220)
MVVLTRTQGAAAMQDGTNLVDTATPSTAIDSSLRRGALAGYRWALLAFLVLGVVQIFLAGLGVFSLHGQELGASGETGFNPHRDLGFGLSGLTFVIAVLAMIGRAGARSIVLSVLAFLMAFLGQSLLADLGESTPVFGGLHALDGLAIIGVTGYLYWSARRSLPSRRLP